MPMEEFDNKQKTKRHLSKKIVLSLSIIFLGMIVIGVGAYMAVSFYQSRNGTFTGYEVVNSIENPGGAAASYNTYGDMLLKYTRDGATTYNSEAKLEWNGSYEMIDPISDVCGKYVAVADRNGRLVHIFGEKGPVGSITTEYPILQVQVANQGVTAVMMEQDNVVYINLYKSNGTLIAPIEKPIEVAGFPLSMALSNDGKKVAFSFLDVTTGTAKTNIACYNFGPVGQNEENNFVGGFIYEGVIAKVDFITNNTVCFYRQNGFTVYHFEEKLSENPVEDLTFESQIRSIFSSNSMIGVVLDSDEDKSKYELQLYDLKGKQILKKGINYDYSGITMNGSDVVLYNYSSCMIVSSKGKIRFQSSFDCNVQQVSETTKGRIVLVSDDAIQVIQLKGG